MKCGNPGKVLAALLGAAIATADEREKKENRAKVKIGEMQPHDVTLHADMSAAIDEYREAAEKLEILDKRADALLDAFWGALRARLGAFDCDLNVDPDTGEVFKYMNEPAAEEAAE